MAAQKRVYQFENSVHGGLCIDQKYEKLQTWIRSSDYIGRVVRWQPWFSQGPVTTLHNNSRDLDSIGLTSEVLLSQAAGRGTRDDPKKGRRCFQKFDMQLWSGNSNQTECSAFAISCQDGRCQGSQELLLLAAPAL